MTSNALSEELRTFILEYFDSIVQLEGALLLRRKPGERWKVSDVARRLYVAEDVAADALLQLRARGLLNQDGELYRYDPRTAELAALLDRLAETYSRSLIPVTNLVHSNPGRLRRFADAFKFRKDR